MLSSDYEGVLRGLKNQGYEVKRGKYVSAKPQYSGHFIRLKSLGEEYSEQAIINRLDHKRQYEGAVNNKISTAKNPDSLEVAVLKSARQYIIVFTQGLLPMRKTNKKKPFAWTNDAELDRLSELNKKINAGATLDSLRNDFTLLENNVAKTENSIAELKTETKLFENLYASGERCFKFGEKNERDLALLAEHEVVAESYPRLKMLIGNNEREIADLEKSLTEVRGKLTDTADTLTLMEKVVGSTHVQSLLEAEKQRQQSEYVKNGLKEAR
jgi:hypothetical protein